MRQPIFCTAILWLAFFVAGCSKSSTSAKQKITLQLKWVYNAGFVGDLVAKEKGFWKQQDLDVEIRPGGVGISPIKVVTTGDAQIGVTTGDQLLLAREEAAPVTAVALAYQDNPLVWIFRAATNIHSIRDFKGKRIGLTFIDDEALFNAMLIRAGIQRADINVVPVKFDTSPFLRGEVDAFPVFRNTQGIEIGSELAKQGIKTDMLGPADLRLIAYSNLYFVDDRFEKSHPEIVRKFVAGVLKGWAYSQDHADEVAEIVSKYDKETSRDLIKAQVEATNRLTRPTSDVTIGRMTEEGWQSTEQILLDAKQLKKPVDVNAVFTKNYVQ
jgi:NitT/TauT family transport system substrate-binding protein